jgi:ribose-phosphate pyrophosphokinase
MDFTKMLSAQTGIDIGELEMHRFPDGESYVRVDSSVKDKKVVLVCTLNMPDEKLLPLYFLSENLKEMGALSVSLVAPYLSYMRQDKAFHPGEAVTSGYFAAFVSSFVDRLITVEPHLHRRSSLSEIYSCPAETIHADELISDWIRNHVKDPLLIGPDKESEQWVSAVAKDAGAPWIVLEKERKGDSDVVVSVPHTEKYRFYTPVLVDDIISTAHTMIETLKHLEKAGMRPAVCLGVHAVFAGDAYGNLMKAGAGNVVSCNTILHASNGIDISPLISALL